MDKKWEPPKPTEENVAGRLGYLAYWQGKKLEDNPYGIFQKLKAKSWSLGWRRAKMEQELRNAD